LTGDGIHEYATRIGWWFWGHPALRPGRLVGAQAKILLVPRRNRGAPAQATDFTLTGPDGKTLSLSDFRGKVWRSTSLHLLSRCVPDDDGRTGAGHAELGAKADNVQVLMVTVDPERDTPDKLNTYVTAFDPASSA